MAYVLGLLFADGAIEDVRKSSRTCYIALTSKDKSLLGQVKHVLSSSHNLYTRKARINVFDNGAYLCSETYTLRIGNKKMYQDLVNLGLTPRKSLSLRLSYIPPSHFNYFLRGYFDGDGNLSIYIQTGRKIPRVRITFVSGSHYFLTQLVNNLSLYLKTTQGTIFTKENTHYLRYSKKDGLKILSYMYENLNAAPYLERKYKIYQSFLLENRTGSGPQVNI